MTADAERTFAKENCRAVFSVLDDQRLRAHGQHFLRGARQVGFVGQHLGFGVVDQQDIDQLQRFREFLGRAFDPVIHGVAAGQAHTVHLAADIGLQRGLDVGQEQKLGVFVLFRNLRVESLEYVQVGEVGLRLVEVVGVGSAPAKGLALGALDAARVDAVLVEDILLLGTEVLAHDGDDAHLGEVAGRQRKVRGGAAENIFHAA